MKRYILLSALFLTACGSTKEQAPQQTLDTPNTQVTIQASTELNRAVLDESLRLGTQYLVYNQKPEGNFNYQYDFIQKTQDTSDSQVRQAGVLWGLSVIYHDTPQIPVEMALRRGHAFMKINSKLLPNGSRMIVYPDTDTGAAGAQALIVLSLVDWLRADTQMEDRDVYLQLLDEYLQFLVSLRRDDGHFTKEYSHEDGSHVGQDISPYFDGESLLALTKAAKYHGYEDQLKAGILESADAMLEKHIIEALKENPDSDNTKGFYQWGSMSFYELTTSGWENTQKYADYTIKLAYWMIDVHATLRRTRNTAYAYEGIIPSYELARLQNDIAAMSKFQKVIKEGLYKLISWQVGSPIANKFLQANPTDDPLAVGGVMNHKQEPLLRIDVAQHQMHALILAKRFLYQSY